MSASNDYLFALDHFFQHRMQTCLEQLTFAIVQRPHHEDLAPLYRLWIEVLAVQEDIEGLKSLGQHLCRMSVDSEPGLDSLFWLAGICWLEADQMPMVKLWLHSDSDDLYRDELVLRMAFRLQESPQRSKLQKLAKQSRDYLQLALVCEFNLLSKSPYVSPSTTEKQIRKLFGETPIPELMKMRNAQKLGAYEGALNEAKSLCTRYPMNSFFRMDKAHLELLCGKPDLAMIDLDCILDEDLGDDLLVDLLRVKCLEDAGADRDRLQEHFDRLMPFSTYRNDILMRNPWLIERARSDTTIVRALSLNSEAYFASMQQADSFVLTSSEDLAIGDVLFLGFISDEKHFKFRQIARVEQRGGREGRSRQFSLKKLKTLQKSIALLPVESTDLNEQGQFHALFKEKDLSRIIDLVKRELPDKEGMLSVADLRRA